MKRRYFILITFGLLILALGLGSWIALREARELSLSSTLDYAESTTAWLKDEYSARTDWPEAAANVTAAYEKLGIPLSISILTTEGTVVYENGVDSGTQAYRYLDPEFQKLIQEGEDNIEIRRSNYFERDLLYFASSFAEEGYYLRVGLPVDAGSNSLLTVTWTVVIISLIVLVLFALAVSSFLKGLRKPLVQLTERVESLQRGEFSIQADTDTSFEQINKLCSAYNETASALKTKQDSLLDSKKFLNVLIDSLSEPLVVCNRQGDVTFINSRAMEVFQRFIDPTERSYPLYFLIHSEEVSDQVLAVLDSGLNEKIDTKLQTADGVRDFSLIISPFQGDQVAIVFHDRTTEVQAEQFRSEFVSNVTHELRTPLTSIRGFIDTIKNNPDISREQQVRFFELMDVEALRLERLIRDLLSLSDIEESDTTDSYFYFDLDQLLLEVKEQMAQVAAEKQISLNVQSGGSYQIKADRDRIKQILLNLIDNAIAYNREDGHVNVSYRVEPDMTVAGKKKGSTRQALLLQVADDGIGLKADDQIRIFERFYRADKGRSGGGTGLGLSIVKHIVRLYDGEIDLQSKWGQGSTFTIKLLLEVKQ